MTKQGKQQREVVTEGVEPRRRPSAATRLQPDELELAWRLARLSDERRRLVVEANGELRRDAPGAVTFDDDEEQA